MKSLTNPAGSSAAISRAFGRPFQPTSARFRRPEIRAADLSEDERKDLASKGQALPDGSYPIPDAEHLHAAAVLAASGHGDAEAAKSLIRRRAAELGVSLKSLPGFGGSGGEDRDSDSDDDRDDGDDIVGHDTGIDAGGGGSE
jgi:hypothetical protein